MNVRAWFFDLSVYSTLRMKEGRDENFAISKTTWGKISLSEAFNIYIGKSL